MTKKDYLENLLNLCTAPQRELFDRMYPNGVDTTKVPWATIQVENTLKKSNFTDADAKTAREQKEDALCQLEVDRKKLNDKIARLNLEITAKDTEISRLESSVNKDDAETTRKLDWLNALECAGVDNWDGYCHAQDIYDGAE